MMRELFPKFILLVGDEGALLMPPDPLIEPLYIESHTAQAAEAALHLMRASPRAEVIILADVLAQEIRGDDFPELGYFDRRNLLQRRLKQAFHETPFAGACGRRDNQILVAGLHASPALAFWLKQLAVLPNPHGVVALLPVEGAALLARLLPDSIGDWDMLLCWQRTGGWRQIVTYKQQPVFTRLTPPLSPNASGEEIAEVFARDIQATLGYLSRLGLTDSRDLNIVALLPASAQLPITKLRLSLGSLEVMTPRLAAARIGLSSSIANDTVYSDELFALALHQTKPLLPLMSRETRGFRLEKKAQYAGFCCATLLWLTLTTCGFAQLRTIAGLWSERLALSSRTASLQGKWDRAHEKLGPETEPLLLMREAVARQRVFSTPAITPWRLIEKLGHGLTQDARVSSLNWQSEGGETLTVTARLAVPLPPTRAEIMDRWKQIVAHIQETCASDCLVQVARYPYPVMAGDTLSSETTNNTEPTADLVLRWRAP